MPEGEPRRRRAFRGVNDAYVNGLEQQLAYGWQEFDALRAEEERLRTEELRLGQTLEAADRRLSEERRDREAAQRSLSVARQEFARSLAKAHGERDLLDRELRECQTALRVARDEKIRAEARFASLRTGLDERVGWVHRVPDALAELARIAAGTPDPHDRCERLEQAIFAAIGPRLLTGVQIGPAAQPHMAQQTQTDTTGSPVCTTTQLRDRAVICHWSPRLYGEQDAVAIVEQLSWAALRALAGFDQARLRESRGIVTQLGDETSLRRHLALRERLGEPFAHVTINVSEGSAGKCRALFGEIAWNAGFAEAGATLEEIARRHGGQAYQVGPVRFAIVIDHDREEQARAEATKRLTAGELDFELGATD